MKRFIYTTAFLLFSLVAMAQNDVQYTQYLFNRMAYNPAYVGSEQRPIINALYRSQWTGGFADGKAPKTGTINFNTPIQCGRGGIGFGFTSDQAGIFNSNRLDAAYAYKFNVSEKGILSAGLGAQLEFGGADYFRTNPFDQGDLIIENGDETFNQTRVNFGAGLYYTHNNNFYIGLSVPQLLKTSYFRDIGISGDGNDFHTYYLMTGFATDLTDNIQLVPGALISFQGQNAPFEFDVNANLVFMEKLWVGLNYRLGDAISGLVQYQLTNDLRAGFAYDFTTSEIRNFSNGTLEFMLSYAFNNYSKNLSNLRYF
ncbi:MAG: type IX secretion system membrane protein PorP/SprF [Bacteroidota bacterium]